MLQCDCSYATIALAKQQRHDQHVVTLMVRCPSDNQQCTLPSCCSSSNVHNTRTAKPNVRAPTNQPTGQPIIMISTIIICASARCWQHKNVMQLGTCIVGKDLPWLRTSHGRAMQRMCVRTGSETTPPEYSDSCYDEGCADDGAAEFYLHGCVARVGVRL
jgi:hypothetical protein